MRSLTGWLGVIVLVATTGLANAALDGTIVKQLVDPNNQNGGSGSSNAVASVHGTVLVQKQGKLQRFVVQVRNGPMSAQGLGVFLDDTPTLTASSTFVNVLASRGATNGAWSLVLQNKTGGAPPFLGGIIDVNELVGKFVFVADQAGNVTALTLITPLLPHPAALSYRNLVKLIAPRPAPSPRAAGFISVSYNGVTGKSTLKIRVRRLAAGNAYCTAFTTAATTQSAACPGGSPLPNGNFNQLWDTSQGEDLPGGVLPTGIVAGVTTVDEIAGVNIFVVDSFGTVHLQGTIPGRPVKK